MPTFQAQPYAPTQNLTGNQTPSLFRGKNLVLRGVPGAFYYEAFPGLLSTGEMAATSVPAGTLTLTAGSKNVSGAGTSFLTDLAPGMALYTNDQYIWVDSVTSDTAFIAANAATANSTAACARLPVLFDVDRKRGTAISGNVLKFEKGTLLGVGRGEFRINGAAVPGNALTLGARPKIQLFNPATSLYGTPYTLGMTSPAAPAVVAGPAGSLNMPAGPYNLAIAPGRTATQGWNQLSPFAAITITANLTMRVSLPAMDTTNGQDSWVFWGSLSGAIGTNTGARVLYKIKEVTATTLGGTGAATYDLEWTDAEVGRNEIATFDNFPAPEAEWVTNLSNLPFYVSCFGDQSGTSQLGKRGGPRIVASKPSNVEAALLNIKNTPSPPELILGALSAPARIFVNCASGIYSLQSSGREDAPLTMRRYLSAGCKGTYGMTLAQQFLYLFSEKSPVRTTAEAEEGVANFDFAADVLSDMEGWVPQKVYVVHNPAEESVIHIHSANHVNAGGFYVSVIEAFSLKYEKWLPPIHLESATDDRVVSGAAKVDNKVYLLVGGRLSANFTVYEYGVTGSGATVDWYAAWNFSDEGSESFEETVESYSLTGRFSQGAVLQIHGGLSESDIDLDAFAAGTGAISGSVTVHASTKVRRYQNQEINMPELSLWSPRLSGTWNGALPVDRIDEIVINERTVEGIR